jgi:hypothetical protein
MHMFTQYHQGFKDVQTHYVTTSYVQYNWDATFWKNKNSEPMQINGDRKHCQANNKIMHRGKVTYSKEPRKVFPVRTAKQSALRSSFWLCSIGSNSRCSNTPATTWYLAPFPSLVREAHRLWTRQKESCFQSHFYLMWFMMALASKISEPSMTDK